MYLDRYVESIDDFCRCIYPSQPALMQSVLESISSGELNKIGNIKDYTERHNLDYDNFNACLRKLKRLGIIYKIGRQVKWSRVFMNRLCMMTLFYSSLCNKLSPLQEQVEDYKKFLEKDVLIKPKYREDEK